MFYIGLDVGQRRDHSAIVVVERVEVRRAYLPPAFARVEVRYAERVPLGTSFAGVVARVGEMVRHPAVAGECQLTVDGTGVGAPVVEMLRSARLGCEISEVTITGGERAHRYRDMGGTAWSVPKQDLLMSVQVLLEREELKIARDLKEAGTLVKELMDVRAKQGARGRVRMGADGHGEHDDLVIALALACWSSGRPKFGLKSVRLTGI